LLFSATDVVGYVYLMYDGYVQTTRVLIRQEIMEILLLQSSTILLPPIFYFSYFAMNIKARWTFLSLLASDTCILSKQLIKVLGPFLSFCHWSSLVCHLWVWIRKWRLVSYFCITNNVVGLITVYHGCITNIVFGPLLTNAVSVIHPLIAVYHVHCHG
jgi:hypothetical protein